MSGRSRAPSGSIPVGARRTAVCVTRELFAPGCQLCVAEASSDWKPARSDAPVVNLLVASEIAFSVATGAAAPCASEDTIVSFANDSMDEATG